MDVDVKGPRSSTDRFEQPRIEIAQATARCTGIPTLRRRERDRYGTVLPGGRIMDVGRHQRIDAGHEDGEAESHWPLFTRELGANYGLRLVGEFPLSSIRVQCIVFEVPSGKPLDVVLAPTGCRCARGVGTA